MEFLHFYLEPEYWQELNDNQEENDIDDEYEDSSDDEIRGEIFEKRITLADLYDEYENDLGFIHIQHTDVLAIFKGLRVRKVGHELKKLQFTYDKGLWGHIICRAMPNGRLVWDSGTRHGDRTSGEFGDEYLGNSNLN